MNPLTILFLLFSVSGEGVERLKLYRQIKDVFENVDDRDIVVKTVLETVNSQTENAYNVMVNYYSYFF